MSVKKKQLYERRNNMLMIDMLDERLIQFHLNAKDKKDAIYKIGELMFQAGKVTNQEQYRKGLFEREKEFATGIGERNCYSTLPK